MKTTNTTKEYICTSCKKTFTRKKSFKETETILCANCKRKFYYESNPEALKASQEKKKKTMLEKYGVDNPSKLPSIKEKISSKLQEFYSDDNNKLEALKKKEQTNLERFGVKHPCLDKDFARACAEKQLLKNGFIGWQNKEFQQQAEKKAHSKEVSEKRKNTWIKNYGVDHPSKHPSIKQKKKDTYKKNTGYEHPQKNPEVIHSNKGYLYQGIHFDSSWELAYYIWLVDNKRDFIYHPECYLQYEDHENIVRNYQPDFLVEGVFYEIKGDQFFNELGEPWNKYTKNFWWEKYNTLIENNVVILREAEIRQYLRYIKDTYGKDYLKQFRTSRISE